MKSLVERCRFSLLTAILVANLGWVGTAQAAPLDLPRSTPATEGVDPQGILDFVAAVEGEGLNLHSLMLVRHGKVVAEGWWKPYAPNLRHTLYSLSKSFTSTAAGFAVAEGKLSVEDKVLSFFPDDAPAEVSPNLAAMRVKHLLMMGAGHEADSLFGGSFTVAEENWVKSVLAREVKHEPGTHFRYNNGATFLVSAIVTKVTGQTVHEYLKPRLFEPLGITGSDWEMNPQGFNNGAWGLRVRTEDIAKLGQLYLQRGQWNGKQILPEAWVKAATGAQISNASGNAERDAKSDWAQGYGYQFWRSQHGAFRGDGAFGQFCLVLPEQDAVLAMTSESNNLQGILNQVWEHLLPAMRGKVEASDKLQAKLAKRLASLELPEPEGQRTSPTVARVSGKIYELSGNSLGYQSVSLNFDDKICIVTLMDELGRHKIPVGIGRWARGKVSLDIQPLHLVNTNPRAEERVACGGAWTDDNTFRMYWRYIETAHYEVVTCTFDGDAIKVEFQKSASILNKSRKDDRPVLEGRVAD